MTNETIKSVKEALELCSTKVSAIEVYYDFSSSIHVKGIHTDTIRPVVAELSKSLDMLPDDMPVEAFEVMDEEEYSSTVDANCDHVPFSDYLQGEDPKILVVILPSYYEEHYQHYTIELTQGEVDGMYKEPYGIYAGFKNGKIVLLDKNGRPFSLEDEKEIKGDYDVYHFDHYFETLPLFDLIVRVVRKHFEKNRSIDVMVRYYHIEDNEWVDEEPERIETVDHELKDITGALVVDWRWQTHVGYAREFLLIRYVSEYDAVHDESLLVEKDRVYSNQSSLLLSAEEVAEAKKMGTLYEQVRENLYRDSWKWQNVRDVYAALDKLKEGGL